MSFPCLDTKLRRKSIHYIIHDEHPPLSVLDTGLHEGGRVDINDDARVFAFADRFLDCV